MISIVTVCIDSHKSIFNRFLSSLKQYTLVEYELIIVDNESQEKDNIELYKLHANKYIRCEKRLSVAEAWNIGAKASKFEYILITNDDIVFSQNWYENMTNCFSEFKKVGLVVPSMNHSLMEQTYIGSIFTLPNACPILLTPFKQWVWGAFMLTTKSILERVNYFSLDYPVASGEDIDFCFTLYKKGYNIVVDRRIFIYHEWGSTGKRILDGKREELYLKNFEIFKKKWKKFISFK